MLVAVMTLLACSDCSCWGTRLKGDADANDEDSVEDAGCDIELSSPSDGSSLDLTEDISFNWTQPCSGSVNVYICPTPNVDDCSSNWSCLAAGMVSGGTASYSGGGGTGYHGAFYCREGGLVSGTTYYWTVDSPWELPDFWSFTVE